MTSQRHNLALRIATAVVGLPLVGLAVFAHDTRVLLLLCLLICALALTEYSGLLLRGRPFAEKAGLVAIGCAFFLATSLRPGLVLPWVISAVLASGLLVLSRASDPTTAAPRVATMVFGVFYVGGLLAALPLLHANDLAGPAWVALAIAMTFANDTGAYFTGRAIGRHKLAPALSPAKTIEGAVGGMGATLLVTLAGRAWFVPSLSLRDCFALALPAAVLGPAGDLLESVLKRSAGAKDSGRLLPGHGGILDRIDALLFVGGYVYVYVVCLR